MEQCVNDRKFLVITKQLANFGDIEDEKLTKDMAPLPVDSIYCSCDEEPCIEAKNAANESLISLSAEVSNFCMVMEKQKDTHIDAGTGSNKPMDLSLHIAPVFSALCQVLTMSHCLHQVDLDGHLSKTIRCLDNLGKGDLIGDFKDFLNSFSSCISMIGNNYNGLADCKKKIVQLCINQIKKCLPLLLQTLKSKKSSAKDVKWCHESEQYVRRRICRCLDEMRRGLGSEGSCEHRELLETECGQFVLLVDEALGLLQSDDSSTGAAMELTVENCSRLTALVEKILCHSMSVSQIAVSSKDSEGIATCGQEVLRDLQSLRVTSVSQEANHHANSLSSKLLSLEQNVNIALLCLVVEVFGNPCLSLRSLIRACTISIQKQETRCAEDLEELIASYDLHMDRIMQIGVFAISCSSDRRRIAGIRCCLASLEYLEPELVPTAISLYLDPSSDSKASHLLFLLNHWMQEVAQLQYLLDGIVDPMAFIRVTCKGIFQLVKDLKKVIFKEGDQSAVDEMVKKIISRAQRTLSVLKQEPLNGQDHLISDLQFSISECKASLKIAFDENPSSGKMRLKNWKRVLQRCQLIASIVKKLGQEGVSVHSVGSSARKSIGDSSCVSHRIGDSLYNSKLHIPPGKLLEQ